MEKYSLELENWGNYELIKDFSSVELAKRHGTSNFPQNEWRVFNRTSGSVMYQHDPFFDIAEEASQHLQRFADTEMWRQRFADRVAQDVVARQQMERFAQYLDDEEYDDRLDLALEKVNWQQEGF